MENMDIIVEQFQAPVIRINYEELKAELERRVSVYNGLVVTEDTLKGTKEIQRELAGLRNRIDAYRKEKKKEIEKPIKEFESQCKELISIVEKVEKPIKDGIAVFDDMRREEKRKKAVEIIEIIAAETGLTEKYKQQLTVIDKYLNLTATESGVSDDVRTRAFALRVEQDREKERIDIISSVLESKNTMLKNKMSLSDFQLMIDRGIETSRILGEIESRFNAIYQAENAPKEEPEAETQEKPAEAVQDAKQDEQQQPVQQKTEKQYTATLKLIGTMEQLRAVSCFVKSNGVAYQVLEQAEV